MTLSGLDRIAVHPAVRNAVSVERRTAMVGRGFVAVAYLTTRAVGVRSAAPGSLCLVRQSERGQRDTREATAEFLQRAAARDGLGQAPGQVVEFIVHKFPFVLVLVCCHFAWKSFSVLFPFHGPARLKKMLVRFVGSDCVNAATKS